MERIQHDLIQGTPEWHQFRLEHHGASEAAAILGLSKNVTRNELLHAKHTGLPKEFSDFVQERILDHGHAVEALARPLVENLIADELYPATWSYGKLSASCDGLTMGGETAFEHKQWAKELAAAVARGELPIEHWPQCQQVMLCTGAKRVIFTVSDGTPEKFVHMEVFPDQACCDQLEAAWAQFDKDLIAYQPPEFIPAAVAKPTMQLPALSIQVNGALTLNDNLKIFGAKLNEFIGDLNMTPNDDQGFADAEAAVKTLKNAEEALAAAEANALAQTSSVEEMRRTVALYAEQARTTRLLLNTMVTERKEQLRVKLVSGGRAALESHIAELNQTLGKPYMPTVTADFAKAIKGLKKLDAMRNAVNTALANAKIEADGIARKIQINLNALREQAKEYAFLFNDTAALVMKEAEFVQLTITSRIDAHKKAKAEELAKIEAAAKEKAEAEARAKIEAENKEKADAEAKIKADAANNTVATQGQTVVEPFGDERRDRNPGSATHPSDGAVERPMGSSPAPATATIKPRVALTPQGPRPSADQMLTLIAGTYRVTESRALEWMLDTNWRAVVERRAQEAA